MNIENNFKKLLKELQEINKNRKFITIIPENKKDERIAKNLTKLLNYSIKNELNNK